MKKQLTKRREGPQPEEFINEEELNDCPIYKILNGEFRDPLLSSDSEPEDEQRLKKAADVLRILDMKKIKSLKNDPSKNRTYIPGLKPIPAYPKLSGLSSNDHHRILRVLAAQDSAATAMPFDAPQQEDHFTYENYKAVYQKEQEEYINWANEVWRNGICMRMFKISPIAQKIYDCDSEFDQQYLYQIPQNYHQCRHISLNTPEQVFKLELIKDLSPKVKSLQPIKLPAIDKKFTILTNKVPEPKVCQQHSLNFILPGEQCATNLPLVRVHEKLAKFAANNEAYCVISSSALTTLVQKDQSWILPVTVKDGIWPNGATKSVVIIDGEIAPQQSLVQKRTKRAFELMLRYALLRESEEAGLEAKLEDLDENMSESEKEEENLDDSDDEKLVMDIEEDERSAPMTRSRTASETNSVKSDKKEVKKPKTVPCTCSESQYGKPFTRSYRKWSVKPKPGFKGYTIPIIVHTSHKIAREDGKEVVLNAIPEYVSEFGATSLTRGELTAKVLDLHLRENARLLTARIDSTSGDIMMFEWNSEQGLETANDNKLMESATNIIHSVVSQLVNLIPGQYILQHGADRGPNATLFQARPLRENSPKIAYISFDDLKKVDVTGLETSAVQTPPILCGKLMPFHLYRRILPLAFTPYKNQIRTFFDKQQKAKEVEEKRKATVIVKKNRKKWNKKKKKLNIRGTE